MCECRRRLSNEKITEYIMWFLYSQWTVRSDHVLRTNGMGQLKEHGKGPE